MEGYERTARTVGAVAGVGGVSAVSWGAIIAGTAVAAAASLLLFALATGLDLASLSAWPRRGVSVSSVTTLAAVTLIVTQWISAGLGGYITGRLRTGWVGTHTHEVFFRDTAHGFITWCVATVLLASGVISPAGSAMSAALRGGKVPAAFASHASCIAPAVPAPEELMPREFIAQPEPGAGKLLLPVGPHADRAADFSRQDGTRLVKPISVQACTAAADPVEAREAATTSVLTALSMLIGAFIASVSAAIGGRLRDRHP